MKAHTKALNTSNVLEHKRDAYGFAVRPQHLQRYREYAKIYKEEEEERSECWNSFLKRQAEFSQGLGNGLHSDDAKDENLSDSAKVDADKETTASETCNDVIKPVHKLHIWTEVRPSLRSIEDLMSVKVKKKPLKDEATEKLANNEDPKTTKNATDEDSEDEFYDMERSDPIQDPHSADSTVITSTSTVEENASLQIPDFQWREELEVLVRGGVPMALRGELWQAFVGVKARRVENYYRDLLVETQDENDANHISNGDCKDGSDHITMTEKWKAQIEKDLPRTFPSHPALDENGRNALRRILTTYARHNPSVGYCQAMNFFAALLLLLMPEENAFWALVAILDDYFEGYYSEEMIESQVDQLVFEELVRERFPKLVNHLDFLGVQVTWVTGPWFLSIFMNMLPWESVLRMWDVLLFEGNRVMLFRTALALMELYGPALVTTKDAGDAVTLLQSLAGSTFDSSQLVLTACMGYQNVSEKRLEELRDKHRSAVIVAVEERIKGLQNWRDSQGLATKLYSFNKGSTKWSEGNLSRSQSSSSAADSEPPDLQDQVVWLKAEVCKLIEDKRAALLRAEELEVALVEMVTQDNRRELSAKVEELELEVSELKRVLEDKKEQEGAMLKVLMRVEQEQRVTEDARRYTEQDAEAQRYAAKILQEKYEDAMASLADMEKRAVMAESMLEATLQYQSSQHKALPSPKSSQNKPEEPPKRAGLLSRPFWRDRNKPEKDEPKHDDGALPQPTE